MDFSCDHYIKTNDLPGLADWLNQDYSNIDLLWSYISTNITSCSSFVCEHSYFMYFGKIKKSTNLFKDDDMNEVASSLGSMSIYSDGRSGDFKDEFVEVKGYKTPNNFMNIYTESCKYVDEDLAFSSVIQILRYSKHDLPKLLKILCNIINKVEKRKSSLVTNTLVSILDYLEENKEIELNPLLEYIESMWKNKDKEDSHGVESSSLQVFCTKVISDMLSGFIVPIESVDYLLPLNTDSCISITPSDLTSSTHSSNKLDQLNSKDNLNKVNKSNKLDINDSCIEMSNLVCKFHENIYNWVCSLSLVQSAPMVGPLDNLPLNEAICLFVLLESEKSLLPKVYSHRTMGLMLFKLAHLFLSNESKNKGKLNIVSLGIKASDLAINYFEKIVDNNGNNQNNYKNDNNEVIDDYNMFPWQPVGYLTVLLNKEDKELDVEKVCNIFKKVLKMSKFDVKIHLLKSVMKSVTKGTGCTICLMECKNTSSKWLDYDENEENHLNFFKYIVDCFFRSELYTSFEDSIYDSLSVLLNWIKYLLIFKNKNIFKDFVKLNYLETLQKLYNKLDKEMAGVGNTYHTSHINNILLNKCNLIKMLLEELFLLIDKHD